MKNTGEILIILLMFLVENESTEYAARHYYFDDCKQLSDDFLASTSNNVYHCPCKPRKLIFNCEGADYSVSCRLRSSPEYERNYINHCNGINVNHFPHKSSNRTLSCLCSTRHFLFCCTGESLLIDFSINDHLRTLN